MDRELELYKLLENLCDILAKRKATLRHKLDPKHEIWEEVVSSWFSGGPYSLRAQAKYEKKLCKNKEYAHLTQKQKETEERKKQARKQMHEQWNEQDYQSRAQPLEQKQHNIEERIEAFSSANGGRK